MPWGDGRGPWWGRGYGCGMPFGFRRFGRMRYPKLTKEDEKEMLKAEKEDLQAMLADIEKRLNELK